MLLGRKCGFLILCIVTSVFALMPTSVVEKSWFRLFKTGFLFGSLCCFFSLANSVHVVGSPGTLLFYTEEETKS